VWYTYSHCKHLIFAFYICCFGTVNIPVIYLWCFVSYKGVPKNSIFGHVTQAEPTYGSFYGPHSMYIPKLKRIEGEFTWEHAHCLAGFDRKFSKSRQNRTQNGGFRQLRGVNIDFCFLTPKRHIVWRITCKNRFWGFGCGALEGWKKKPSKHFWRVISRIWGNETPEGIMTKFCMWIDIQDLITCATFGLDRIRGSGAARGRIFRFLIDLRRRPYNTLALPCECVVQASSLFTTTLWCQYSLVTASTQWMQSRFLTILLSC